LYKDVHVWGEVVVLVDADFQVDLHCFLEGRNAPLNGSLERKTTTTRQQVHYAPKPRYGLVLGLHSSVRDEFSHLHHLDVLLAAANGHFGLQKLKESLMKKNHRIKFQVKEGLT
jgi:hypothetical protein